MDLQRVVGIGDVLHAGEVAVRRLARAPEAPGGLREAEAMGSEPSAMHG